jgi:hypothetical protein
MTDVSQIRCFHCREYGHLTRGCPARSKPGKAGVAPAGRRDSEQEHLPAYSNPLPPQRPLSEIADYAACAARARAILAASTGRPVSASPPVITEFRQAAGLPERSEAGLREIAAKQVAEARMSP